MRIFSKKKKIPEFTFQLSRIRLSTKENLTTTSGIKAGQQRDTDQIQHEEKKNSNPLFMQIGFFRQINLQVEKHTFSLNTLTPCR